MAELIKTMETSDERFAKLRKNCHDKAFYSYASSYIFDKKAQRFAYFVRLLKVFGILVPTAIGGVVMAYGLNSKFLELIIIIATPFPILQLVISVLSVANNWDGELTYAYEASQDYSLMSDEFKKLGSLPPPDYDQLNVQYEMLNARYNAREQQSSKHNVKEWEDRMSMRYALRQFQKKCVGCKETPLSLESTDCDVCGKFNKSIYYKLFKP